MSAPCETDRLSEVLQSETSNTPQIKNFRNCNKEKGEVEVEEQAQATSPSTQAVPTPPPYCKVPDEGPELYELQQEWRDNKLDPIDVRLGDMPDWANSAMRAIADHMRLLMGLRLTRGDDRPLPYALSLAVSAGVAANPTAASRAIGQLVRAGVIVKCDPLPPLAGRRGTNTYAPPAAAVTTLRRAA
jgi:hypothetical protein